MRSRLHRAIGAALLSWLLTLGYLYLPPFTATLFAALGDNLVACWALDEASGNATDAAVGNDLTDNNTVTSAAGAGASTGTSRAFASASSEYFSRADNADLSFGNENISFAGWAYLTTNDTTRYMFTKWADPTFEYLFSYITGTGIRLSAGGGTKVTSTFGTLSTATWYLVAAGYSATADEFWISVNANTPDVASDAGGFTDGAGDFRMSSEVNGNSGHWNGRLDEWAVWRRDIRADLATLYNSASGTSCSTIMGGGAAAASPGPLLGVWPGQ